MPHSLKIETYSPGMQLYVGCISKMQLTTLEKACPSLLGVYRKKALERLWYHNPKLMQKVFGIQSWREICLPKQHYYGPLLSSKDGLNDFLENVEIVLDEQAVRIDARQIKCQFKAAHPLPVLKMDQVAVFHGEYFTGHTFFISESVAHFKPHHLKMIFVECGENGYILSKIRYADQILYPRDRALEKEDLKLYFVARN
jgi:hypothetical protein